MDISDFKFDQRSQTIVNLCKSKSQNDVDMFYHIQVAYFLGKIASLMGTRVNSPIVGSIIPSNIYAINLAPSGYGKGASSNIIDNKILGKFRQEFMNHTIHQSMAVNIDKLALESSRATGISLDEAKEIISAEANKAGHFPYAFDEGSTPAIKQVRHKIILLGCGALNLEVDEVGMNLATSIDALSSYLELYDLGRIKAKLTKNSSDNKRDEDRDGVTPSNLLMFGTANNLFDGSETENAFLQLLDTGYARRSLFGYIDVQLMAPIEGNTTIQERYAKLTNKAHDTTIQTLSAYFASLADSSYLNQCINVPPDVDIRLLEYKEFSMHRSNKISETESIRKTEMMHRHFKAIKLAGVYAFINKHPTVEHEDLEAAICLVEASGKAFERMLNRDKSHVKLAKFIAEVSGDVTRADLIDKLPFYKKASAVNQKDLMNLARAWGYRNNIILRYHIEEGIDFYSGETLQPTDIDNLTLSYSAHIADNYSNVTAAFDQLPQLVEMQDMQFTNHHLKGGDTDQGHRSDENCIPGFNMVVLDFDKTPLTPRDVSEMFDDTLHIIYTTKSMGLTAGLNSFRMIMPTNFILNLDKEDFGVFMENVYAKMAIAELDTGTKDRSRKWATCAGCKHIINTVGEPLDVLPLIPRTSRNEEFNESQKQFTSLSSVERFFIQRCAEGNRNKTMHRYAMMLGDSGMDAKSICKTITAFNKKLDNPLGADELEFTVFKTVNDKFSK